MKNSEGLITCRKRNENLGACIARYYVCGVQKGFARQTVLVGGGGRNIIPTTVAVSLA